MTQCRDFLLACVRDNPRLTGAIIAFNTRCPAVLEHPADAADAAVAQNPADAADAADAQNTVNSAGAADAALPRNSTVSHRPALPVPHGVRPEAAPLLPLFARDAGPGSRMAGRARLLYTDTAGPYSGPYSGQDAGPSSGPPTWWALDFRVVRHRLALLDADTLTRLARWCGLLRHKAEIARMIDRESVLALRAEVGEEGHRFVLRRSALLPGARDLEAAPEGGGPIGARLRASGYAMIASCLADAPGPTTAMVLRTAPGMFADALRAAVPAPASPFPGPGSGPGSDSSPGPVPSQAANDPSRHWPLIRTLLFKEIAPAWEPCFT